MKREKILAMKPGEHLDRIVALRVMGYEESKMMDGWVRLGALATYPKRYSTDISAAWEVVEKIPVDIIHPYAGFRLTKLGNSVTVSFDGTEVSAKTAPEAICKAALLAVLEEEEA